MLSDITNQYTDVIMEKLKKKCNISKEYSAVKDFIVE